MDTKVHAAPDLAAIKSRQQTVWASGDYSNVGTRLVVIAEQLCETIDLRAGERVLDVATGNGITALAAARRYAEVTGIDYVPSLIERARTRAAADHLPVDFQVADAEALPFADGSFDVVLSTVGVMFAPDQARAAAELLRVCRSGGRIGLASWTPEGFLGQLFKLIASHAPPPEGLNSPMRWGSAADLRELLGEDVVSIEVRVASTASATGTPPTGSASSALPTARSTSSSPGLRPTARRRWRTTCSRCLVGMIEGAAAVWSCRPSTSRRSRSDVDSSSVCPP